MSLTLPLQLAIATAMVCLTALIHLAGLSVLIAILRAHGHRLDTVHERLGLAARVLVVVLGLFALHTVEIWAYAGLFRFGRATSSLQDALLYATGSYVTSGSSEVEVGRFWRLIGAIEGANGVLLLGWSTAFFVTVVARIRALEDEWDRRG